MKKIIFGLSAFVLAIAFSAFTTPTTAEKFRLKNAFFGNANSYDPQTGILQYPANWIFDNTVSCAGGQYACSFTIYDYSDQELYHSDLFGDIILNTISDIDDFSANPVIDQDGDGIEDILMFITTVNGSVSVPESSPTRYYQKIYTSYYCQNAFQKASS
jgi:hypothetical protein